MHHGVAVCVVIEPGIPPAQGSPGKQCRKFQVQLSCTFGIPRRRRRLPVLGRVTLLLYRKIGQCTQGLERKVTLGVSNVYEYA